MQKLGICPSNSSFVPFACGERHLHQQHSPFFGGRGGEGMGWDGIVGRNFSPAQVAGLELVSQMGEIVLLAKLVWPLSDQTKPSAFCLMGGWIERLYLQIRREGSKIRTRISTQATRSKTAIRTTVAI